ncbi:hypothetical protein NEF87_001287 [Candidatus Lokiarchaeum ossiferum]|uniref:RING-type domain-containing protein n=1 Tax=Candidatus Lokiarchaeum ossiferum TaxID=2951803 RepID=A0ABY6HNC6_9ARCH|nr:hypothetical protein NEF87_001287 [Candidatus Lokiarchaeum sp. B-35]
MIYFCLPSSLQEHILLIACLIQRYKLIPGRVCSFSRFLAVKYKFVSPKVFSWTSIYVYLITLDVALLSDLSISDESCFNEYIRKEDELLEGLGKIIESLLRIEKKVQTLQKHLYRDFIFCARAIPKSGLQLVSLDDSPKPFQKVKDKYKFLNCDDGIMNIQPDQQENQIHHCKKCNELTPHSLCENCSSWVCDYCAFGCSHCKKVICVDCLKVVLGEEYEVVGYPCTYCEGQGKIEKIQTRIYHHPCKNLFKKKFIQYRIEKLLVVLFWFVSVGIMGLFTYIFFILILPTEHLGPKIFAGIVIGLLDLEVIYFLPAVIKGKVTISFGASDE